MTDIEKKLRQYAVLVIDKDGENLEAFRQSLRESFNIVTVGGVEEGLKEMAEGRREIAVVAADYRLPGGGIEALERCKKLNPDIVTILMFLKEDSEHIFRALHFPLINGVLIKPWRADETADLLRDGIKKYQENLIFRRKEERFKMACEYLKDEIREYRDYHAVVGKDTGLNAVMEQVKRVAPASGNVLITGEVGTGRELIARVLHALSPRGNNLFIKLDTAELTPREIEQRLFGVEKISAESLEKKPGLLELAEGSTIFIKDIADLPLETQVKLTRALKEGDYERVGGRETLKSNVRVIAASSGNLEELVARRQFRSELFNELSAFTINIPPLRERKGDIPALAQFYVDKYSRLFDKGPMSIEPAAMADLEAYDWRGNIIELQAVLMLAVISTRHEKIRVKNIVISPPWSDSEPVEEMPESALLPKDAATLEDKLEELEKRAIKEALKKAKGHKTKAAEMLGMNRSTMYYRMKKYGIKIK